MADMLMRLPGEVFLLITEKLTKADLKILSQASRWLRESVASRLWQSITIEPWSEYGIDGIRVAGLPQSCLQRATQLHFRSGVQHSITRRCPHAQGFDDLLDTDDEYDEDDQFHNHPRFHGLARKAESLLRRIEAHRLQSFSWGFGTCVPSEILGANGIVPAQQSSINSLSLITDPTCLESYEECEIDLSSFCNLESLSWRGPNAEHLNALAIALRGNSTHLKRLELDFVNWTETRQYLDFLSDGEDEMDGIKETDYFTNVVLGLNKRSERPLFPTIRVLSLSQVPLSAAMARAFNFDALVSLTLRTCPGWVQFVEGILQLNHPIKLKILEIQDYHDETTALGDIVTQKFLNAFEGLEELFVGQVGPISALDLWDHVVRHHPTLKRFVYHQRSVDLDEESPHYEEFCDVPDLGSSESDMRRIGDPSQNPLGTLDLEFIGLACVPKILKCVLLPFASKACLKVLQIRQSGSDFKQYGSWAISNHSVSAASGTGSDTSYESGDSLPQTDSGFTTPVDAMQDDAVGPNVLEVATEKTGVWHGPTLQPEFLQFAEWAFGPQGIASLDIVAFGDFAHGGRVHRNNLLLCRNEDETSNFRLLDEDERKWKEARDKYRDAIEACPVEPLFKF